MGKSDVIDRADQGKVDSAEGSECSMQTYKRAWTGKSRNPLSSVEIFPEQKNPDSIAEAQEPKIGNRGFILKPGTLEY